MASRKGILAVVVAALLLLSVPASAAGRNNQGSENLPSISCLYGTTVGLIAGYTVVVTTVAAVIGPTTPVGSFAIIALSGFGGCGLFSQLYSMVSATPPR